MIRVRGLGRSPTRFGCVAAIKPVLSATGAVQQSLNNEAYFDWGIKPGPARERCGCLAAGRDRGFPEAAVSASAAAHARGKAPCTKAPCSYSASTTRSERSQFGVSICRGATCPRQLNDADAKNDVIHHKCERGTATVSHYVSPHQSRCWLDDG